MSDLPTKREESPLKNRLAAGVAALIILIAITLVVVVVIVITSI
jgi:hypothetical protein